jgi:arginyl-tRNA--protein-N-Asp/Glu arginylyltransferase
MEGHARRTRRLAQILEESGLEPGAERPCPYLPGRTAKQIVVLPPRGVPELYHSFMDLNFRRLGSIYYRPTCEGCTECRALRVLVEEFVPSRAQRRCLARNADLQVEIGAPIANAEKHDLYQRYLAARHDGQMDGSWDELTESLYDTPPTTLELSYRLQDRLVSVGLVDVEPRALSAVYCYFDPKMKGRSLGIFNVLRLVEESQLRGAPFLYLGYQVAGSPKMEYKAAFRPNEVLSPDGRWERDGG